MNHSLNHIRKMNTLFVYALALHLPIMLLTAWIFDTGLLFATGAWLAILSGPAYLTLRGQRPELAAISHGMAVMALSGLLIHLGKGMIEMHFHVFVGLAVTAVFGYIWVPLAAAATIAVHHVGFFFFLPTSVFNYEASLAIVLVHAVFVVVETLPVTYIAMLFGRFIRAQELLTEQFGSAFRELQTTSEDLGSVSGRQMEAINDHSASVQETAAAMAEIKSMIEQTAHRVKECAELSRTVTDRTTEGTQVMGQLSMAMESIQQSNEQLQAIERIVNEIDEKTAVIHSIVEKTELLSFNASIEAARAGQHGRGFAVVAEEVGKLASLSGTAARDISALLKESRRNVSDIISVVHNRVSEGKNVTAEALTKFDEIEKNVSQIQARVASIADASREQEKGIEQTSIAMQRLNTHSQKTAESSKKVNETASGLHNQAELLKKVYDETTALVEWKMKGAKSKLAPVSVPSVPHESASGTAPQSTLVAASQESPVHVAERIKAKYKQSA